MSDLMQFDLVSPEAALISIEASSVEIPGAEGDFTAMPQHASLITSLRPGLLKVNSNDGTKEYIVTGGFVEINASSTSVLAEQAFEKDNLTKDYITLGIVTALGFLSKYLFIYLLIGIKVFYIFYDVLYYP